MPEDTSDQRAPQVQTGTVVVSCPNCGSPDYEIEFDSDDIAKAATIIEPCDECGKSIEVMIDVTVQSGELSD